jgi:hypothetical protein
MALIIALILLISTATMAQEIQYTVESNTPFEWRWLSSAALHTQNFNSVNMRAQAQFKLHDMFMLQAQGHLPIWATAFSGDPASGRSMQASGGICIHFGGIYREKDRVNIGSENYISGSTSYSSSSYFEPMLKVYSYVGLRAGLYMDKAAQAVNAREFRLQSADNSIIITDTSWTGETYTTSSGIYIGLEFGRDNNSVINYAYSGFTNTINPRYCTRYYLDFLYLPGMSYSAFKVSDKPFNAEFSGNSSTQMGARIGMEQNSAWFTWGGELGLHRRFGNGQSTKLSENGYGYICIFAGITLADW